MSNIYDEPWKHELSAFIDEAEKRGLWLYASYHQLWFSPAELRAEHVNGKFMWSAENFKIRDPQERLDQLDLEAESIAKARENMTSRIST